jgi:hypothetical protein
MRAKSLLIAASCVNLVLPLGPTLGDGGVFIRRKSYTYVDMFQPTQKVYIRWDGAQEKLLIQTKYEGPAEEMVWIIPVPAQPTVERARSYGYALPTPVDTWISTLRPALHTA